MQMNWIRVNKLLLAKILILIGELWIGYLKRIDGNIHHGGDILFLIS